MTAFLKFPRKICHGQISSRFARFHPSLLGFHHEVISSTNGGFHRVSDFTAKPCFVPSRSASISSALAHIEFGEQIYRERLSAPYRHRASRVFISLCEISSKPAWISSRSDFIRLCRISSRLARFHLSPQYPSTSSLIYVSCSFLYQKEMRALRSARI